MTFLHDNNPFYGHGLSTLFYFLLVFHPLAASKNTIKAQIDLRKLAEPP